MGPPRASGVVLGRLNGSLAASWVFFTALGVMLEPLGGVLAPLEAVLGPLGAVSWGCADTT